MPHTQIQKRYGQAKTTVKDTGNFQHIIEENNIMITLIKMKYKEWMLKLEFYSMIEAFVKEQENIARVITNIYESIKDVSGKELQDKLITAIAELAHDQAVKEREAEKTRPNNCVKKK